MLTCLPKSICSWNYTIPDASGGPAEVALNFMTEQGSILFESHEFEIRKHGPLSGQWTLENQGQVVGQALKPNAFFRSFDLNVGGVEFTLKAASAFTRSFEIIQGGNAVATITPAHAFTRRASIESDPAIPELAQLFAFWLVVLCWRRQSNSQSTAAAGT